MLQRLTDLRALRAQFDGFLVDLWGVVHDGALPFQGVVEGLTKLSESGARVCFISNSSRRGEHLEAALVSMGLARDLFVAVVSSGDVTREALLRRDPAVFDGLPQPTQVLHLGSPAFVPWLFDLPLTFVTDPERAQLVIATGTVPDDAALRSLQERLEPLARAGIPLVCTNPDRVVGGAGGLHIAPGAVAHAYAEVGGRVAMYGKPHAPIYRAGLQRLGLPPARVVGVGDMLATDIRGARSAGLASVLITQTGVHGAELEDDDGTRLRALCEEHGVTPTFVLERLA